MLNVRLLNEHIFAFSFRTFVSFIKYIITSFNLLFSARYLITKYILRCCLTGFSFYSFFLPSLPPLSPFHHSFFSFFLVFTPFLLFCFLPFPPFLFSCSSFFCLFFFNFLFLLYFTLQYCIGFAIH